MSEFCRFIEKLEGRIVIIWCVGDHIKSYIGATFGPRALSFDTCDLQHEAAKQKRSVGGRTSAQLRIFEVQQRTWGDVKSDDFLNKSMTESSI